MLVDRWGFQFLIQIDGDDDGIKFFFYRGLNQDKEIFIDVLERKGILVT